jgi:PKD repeat protein
VVDAPISGLAAYNSGPTPLNYQVMLTAIISSGGNVGYVWDFGDGAGGSGWGVYHQYAAEGLYTATVTASNSINTLTAATVVTITEAGPTDVFITGFGRGWTERGGMGWPVAAGVVMVGILVVVVVVRRRGR